MKRIFSIFFLAALCCASAFGQASSIRPVSLSQAEVDKIIAKFTQGERLFRQALNVYAFNRSATVQTVGIGGPITGTFRRDSFMTFNSAGERIEKIMFAPVSTLTEISMGPADLENLGGLDIFAIEPKNMSRYNFRLVGKERIDELDLYVFEVTPKVMPPVKRDGEKLFSGRIWVDDQDFMIVKTKGKAVPEAKNERFPVLEVWRENIDGKFWFPSFATSDDELIFDNGQVVKMRVRMKYSNYRVGRTDVKVIEEEDAPPPTPTPKKP